jgi:hypothetical protein
LAEDRLVGLRLCRGLRERRRGGERQDEGERGAENRGPSLFF